MTSKQWQNLEYKEVVIKSGMREHLRLGGLLGRGGAGTVYDLCKWNNRDWVIKVLDQNSTIAAQEIQSINAFHGLGRFTPGLMKFNSWRGTLVCDGQEYSCYFMRKGKTLKEAITNKDDWLNNPKEVMRLIAVLVNGICSLKNMGLSHRDIKAENILLYDYCTRNREQKLIPVFSDYGTVSKETHSIGTFHYQCRNTEYDSELEKGIAYDLHCLYMTLRGIYEDIDIFFPVSIILPEMPECIEECLCIMSDSETKAFDRLYKLTEYLKKEKLDIPVSFYLDAIPRYQLENDFPFETIIQWNDYAIVRDKNTIPNTVFDPLLLMKIPAGRYETACDLLVALNDINQFVMPIAHYSDNANNEYVLIHAPDDRRKCTQHSSAIEQRIQDAEGVPYTLEQESAINKSNEMRHFISRLSRQKVNIEFSPKDIWHMDDKWKLNLFSVDLGESADKDAEKICLHWKKIE